MIFKKFRKKGFMTLLEGVQFTSDLWASSELDESVLPNWFIYLFDTSPNRGEPCLCQNNSGWFYFEDGIIPIEKGDWIIESYNDENYYVICSNDLILSDFDDYSDSESLIEEPQDKPGQIETLIERQTVALEEIAENLKTLRELYEKSQIPQWNIPYVQREGTGTPLPQGVEITCTSGPGATISMSTGEQVEEKLDSYEHLNHLKKCFSFMCETDDPCLNPKCWNTAVFLENLKKKKSEKMCKSTYHFGGHCYQCQRGHHEDDFHENFDHDLTWSI